MNKENRVGLELAIIIHLVVAIVLLCIGINNVSTSEAFFVLDFTREEELLKKLEEEKERLEQEQKKEEIQKSVEEMIAQKKQEMDVRNVARNRELKDDRHSSKELKELNEKAQKLQQDLKNNSRNTSEDTAEEAVPQKQEQKSQPKQEIPVYKGRSTVEYSLGGRGAQRLPVPAYQCINGGEVTVKITVNRSGRVVEAEIDKDLSTNDEAMRSTALSTAKRSIFEPSASAPERQRGSITYIFIPQNSR